MLRLLISMIAQRRYAILCSSILTQESLINLFPQLFPFNENFLPSLETGSKIMKLGSRSGLTKGRLLSVNDTVVF